MIEPRAAAAEVPVVSRHRDGRDEWIISTPAKTELVRGARTLDQADQHRLPSEAGAGLVLDWPQSRTICDSPGDWARWQTAEDIAAAVRGPGHHYVVAIRDISGFLTGIASANAFRTPVLVYGQRLLVGPLLQPGRGPCGACYGSRLMSRLRSLRHRVERDHVLIADPGRVADLVAAARTLWERRTPQRPLDELMAIDLARGSVDYEKVIPRSGCGCVDGDHSLGVLDQWVGAAVGMAPEPSRPQTALSLPYHVLSTRTGKGGVAGAAGLDEVVVRRRTLGESVERYALHTLPSHAWQSAGWWVTGKRLRTGERVDVPAHLVSRAPECDRPGLPRAPGSGVAAAESVPAATTSALLELVERETVVNAWLGPETRSLDAVTWAPRHAAVAGQMDCRLTLTVIDLPNRPPVVVAALVGPDAVASYGSACDFDPARACLHAAEEAFLMWHADAASGDRRPWLPVLDDVPAGEPVVRSGLDGVLADLDPIAVDLTCAESQAVGTYVVATLPGDLQPVTFPSSDQSAATERAGWVTAAFGTRRPS